MECNSCCHTEATLKNQIAEALGVRHSVILGSLKAFPVVILQSIMLN